MHTAIVKVIADVGNIVIINIYDNGKEEED